MGLGFMLLRMIVGAVSSDTVAVTELLNVVIGIVECLPQQIFIDSETELYW